MKKLTHLDQKAHDKRKEAQSFPVPKPYTRNKQFIIYNLYLVKYGQIGTKVSQSFKFCKNC